MLGARGSFMKKKVPKFKSEAREIKLPIFLNLIKLKKSNVIKLTQNQLKKMRKR